MDVSSFYSQIIHVCPILTQVRNLHILLNIMKFPDKIRE
jgi:hypothetical protein